MNLTDFMNMIDGHWLGRHGSLVIGATSDPWSLDRTLIDTFPNKLHIPLPDVDERIKILKESVGPSPCIISQRDYRVLASKMKGYSDGAIDSVIQEAVMQSIHRVRRATHYKTVPLAFLVLYQAHYLTVSCSS